MTEIIDMTEWSQERRTEWAKELVNDDPGGAGFIKGLKQDAAMGCLDYEGTFTTRYHGESRAAALGRAYKVRDTLEERAPVTVDCDLTGRRWLPPDDTDLWDTYYEIEITVESCDE